MDTSNGTARSLSSNQTQNRTESPSQPKCGELRAACAKAERAVAARRELLRKFMELFDALEGLNKWCSTAAGHLERDGSGGGRHNLQVKAGPNSLTSHSEIRSMQSKLFRKISR